MADRYDCAKPPATVPPNADISGIGVVTGYVTTAGLTIAIIVVSFLFAHNPNEDPFQSHTRAQNPNQPNAFRPNPVDVAIFSRFRRRTLQPRFKDAAIKCVLAMSDLQILTGYSILISGYLQLYSGLSAYHWQMLVYLAWFSSLTHLSCLTFLRSYLYHRRIERAWRLIAMGLLIAMLIFALIPTGNYAWTSDDYTQSGFDTDDTDARGPALSDYARCHYFYGPNEIVDEMTFLSMILSVLLLGFGFIIRTFKLHRRLSVEVVGSMRKGISRRMHALLTRLYNRLDLGNAPKPLLRKIVYRPALASFLVLQISFDVWASMTVEVWWLVASFFWGFANLIETRALNNGGNSDWTFGQVIPVVLLAAPMLSAFESLLLDDLKNVAGSRTAQPDDTASVPAHPSQTQTPEQQPMQTALPETSEGAEFSIDHPDRDYYTTSPWIKSFIWFIMVDMVASTALIFYQSAGDHSKLVDLLIPSEWIWTWLPIYKFLVMLLFILFSFLIEEFSLKRRHQSISGQKLKIAIFSTWILASGLLAMVIQSFLLSGPDFAVWVLFVFYFFCAGGITPYRVYYYLYKYCRIYK